MNAYDLSEVKSKLIKETDHLNTELVNSTDTILLTNDEVMDIIVMLGECVKFINNKLKSVQVD